MTVCHVAPLAGAWIEILMDIYNYMRGNVSLPSRERGLKYKCIGKLKEDVFVAPLAGAWIEILIVRAIQSAPIVAPLAGAWIEIRKYYVLCSCNIVAPLAGAWIEIFNTVL